AWKRRPMRSGMDAGGLPARTSRGFVSAPSAPRGCVAARTGARRTIPAPRSSSRRPYGVAMSSSPHPRPDCAAAGGWKSSQISAPSFYRIEPRPLISILEESPHAPALRPCFVRRSSVGNARNIAFWVVLFLLILALFNLFGNGQTAMNARSMAYSDFVRKVDAGEVSAVVIDGEQIQIQTKDGQTFVTVQPQSEQMNDKLVDTLIAKDVSVKAERQQQSG